jgi:hypothetical protein
MRLSLCLSRGLVSVSQKEGGGAAAQQIRRPRARFKESAARRARGQSRSLFGPLLPASKVRAMRAATWCPRTPFDKRAAGSRAPAGCANWIGRATSDPVGNGPPTVPGGSLPVARLYRSPCSTSSAPWRFRRSASDEARWGRCAGSHQPTPSCGISRSFESTPPLGKYPGAGKSFGSKSSAGETKVLRRLDGRPGTWHINEAQSGAAGRLPPSLLGTGCRQSPVRLRSPGIS